MQVAVSTCTQFTSALNFNLRNWPGWLIVRPVGREKNFGGAREALWKMGLKTI
jgi:hypothetical protein